MKFTSDLRDNLQRRLTKYTKRQLGCWIWQGATNSMGYGRLHWSGTTVLAHRAAWFVANGPIPDHMCVCHRCDTPLCVRPSHLFLGTHSDNMKDSYAKGRHQPVRLYGTRHGMAKLTDPKVREIRRLGALGVA